LPNLVNTSGVVACNMQGMFQNAISFNQNISGWNMVNTSTIQIMFNSSGTLSSTVCKFNNGQLGYENIQNGILSTAEYTNSSKVLTCTGALFLTELTTSDVLIITTSSVIYSSAIQSITNDTSLTLVTAYGSNLSSPSILSISKQIAGTAPLLWNLPNTTNMTSAFRNCPYFNQNVSTTVSKWNVNKVTNVSTMFQGSSTALIHLFNNGEIITGTSSPLNWIFTVTPTSTNWRNNCRLQTANVVTTPPLP
jgi:hypothetical protein